MYSELFRIPMTWLNTSITDELTVAVLLAGLVIVGMVGWVVFGTRRGAAAEAWQSVPGLLLLAVLVVVVPRIAPDGIPIRGYGIMVLTGIVIALWMATARARQVGLNPEIILSLAFAMMIGGILGARAFYVIEYWETRFQFDDWTTTLVAILKFTEGGLVVYGSLIGLAVAFLFFVRRHRLPMLAMADLAVPSLLAGLALGRIGCLLNGCCYGGESTRPWAVTFPPESMVYQEQVAGGRMLGLRLSPGSAADQHPEIVAVDPGSPAEHAGLATGMKILAIGEFAIHDLQHVQRAFLDSSLRGGALRIETDNGRSFELTPTPAPARSRRVHPTQVYSAIQAALLAWVLWSFYPYRRRDGEVAALMLSVYPVARFLLEIIRTDESAVFGTGMSISQNISLVLLGGAAALWIFLSRQPRERANFGPAAA